MNSKQAIVNTMEEDLARDCKVSGLTATGVVWVHVAAQVVMMCAFDLQEYDDLRHSCMKRLRDKGISLHDFHFKPTKQVLTEVTSNI